MSKISTRTSLSVFSTNKSPESDSSNLATTLSGCMGLVNVAGSVHAVDIGRLVVDLALPRQNNVLWTSIASNPIAWAELGPPNPLTYHLSRRHCACRGQMEQHLRCGEAELHPHISEMCQRKFDE